MNNRGPMNYVLSHKPGAIAAAANIDGTTSNAGARYANISSIICILKNWSIWKTYSIKMALS